MFAPLSMLALLMASQVSAVPALWNTKYAGCQLPDKGYGAHKAPIPDTDLAFALTDSKGTAVKSYAPGGTYTLKLTYPSAMHAWIVTTAGKFTTLAGQDGAIGDAPDCTGMTAYMSAANASPSFSVTWTAGTTCEPVTVSANAAKGQTDTYRQNNVTVACDASAPPAPATTPATPTPAGTPPSTATPSTPTPSTPSPSPAGGGAASIVASALAVIAALAALLL